MEDEIENLYQNEEPHMTESDKIKLRLRKFCYVIGALLILWVISIIIVFAVNKPQDNNISWDEAYKRAHKFISNLNPTEINGLLNGTNNIETIMSPYKTKNEISKNKLCEGQIPNNSKIKFKGMCIQEGTTGVRFSNETGILWQSEINTAATFNKTLMYKIGKAQGEESKEKGINTLLSPSVNIMSLSQNDIFWESFGENPFYSGICASEIIKGIQENGVISTIKYFLGNDSKIYENLNSFNNDNNVILDNYLEPFYRAIHDSQVGAVMISNEALNKTYYNKERNNFTNILRDILEFKGFALSDLFDTNNKSIYNCFLLDLNLGKNCAGELPKQIQENDSFGGSHSYLPLFQDTMKNKSANESALRIIATMYKMNQMDDYPEVNLYNYTRKNESIKIQKEAAIESQVLLKNEKNILPLQNDTKIVVIGNISIRRDCQFGNNIPLGIDSNSTKSECFISPLEEFKKLAPKNNVTVKSLSDIINSNTRKKETGLDKIESIVKKFQKKSINVAIVFVTTSLDKYLVVDDGLNSSLWYNVDNLINITIEYKIKVIVVINTPTVPIPSWLSRVDACLFSGYPGAEASQAIVKILFGEKNPSGHLPFTWKDKGQPYPSLSFLDNVTKVDKKIEKIKKDEFKYNGIDSDGLLDDIKNYGEEKYNYFPFGFGLSYSSFIYSSNLTVFINETCLTAIFNITNNSTYPGQAVPMMFLNFPDIKGYPEYLFKGFEKVKIEPNKTQTVTIVADDHALSNFKSELNKYVRVNGTINVYIVENGKITIQKNIKTNYTSYKK